MRITTLEIEWNHKQYFIGPKKMGKEEKRTKNRHIYTRNKKILDLS